MQVSMPLWWSIVLVAALVSGLAACDSPSPAFREVPARQVVMDGERFSVRATRFEAEALRLGPGPPRRRAPVVWSGAKAIVSASGCALVPRSLEGDAAIVRADLDCPGSGPRPWRRPRAEVLDCGFTSPWRGDGFGSEVAEFECQVQP